MVSNDEYDPLVRPIVQYFNDIGLTTKMSCQGHNSTNLSMFWVEFANEVSEDDIASFMTKHLNQYGHFCSCGRFCNRLYVVNSSVIVRGWYYMAATPDAAREDLRRWTNGYIREVV